VTLEEAERSHILHILEQTRGVVGGRDGAAALLGLPRTTLIDKMKRLRIERACNSVLSSKSEHGLRPIDGGCNGS
jgi:transcriptional regulator with GAF, ATPase, and Fis domain